MTLEEIRQSPDALHHSVLTIDTARRPEVLDRTTLARRVGAPVVKLGLEALMSFGPKECSLFAQRQGLRWIADFKFADIERTNLGAVSSLAKLDYPPVAYTLHALCGFQSMQTARKIAEDAGIMTMAVAQLTSITDAETRKTFNMPVADLVLRLAHKAVEAGVTGLVCSAQELTIVNADIATKELFTLVPSTRSLGVIANDQARIGTPKQAMIDGADLLVLGRQVTDSEDQLGAYRAFVAEMQLGLNTREVT